MVSARLGERRLSVKDLERGTGMAYPSAYAIYAGQTKAISFEALDKLCKFFGCQPDYLFPWTPDEDSGQAAGAGGEG